MSWISTRPPDWSWGLATGTAIAMARAICFRVVWPRDGRSLSAATTDKWGGEHQRQLAFLAARSAFDGHTGQVEHPYVGLPLKILDFKCTGFNVKCVMTVCNNLPICQTQLSRTLKLVHQFETSVRLPMNSGFR